MKKLYALAGLALIFCALAGKGVLLENKPLPTQLWDNMMRHNYSDVPIKEAQETLINYETVYAQVAVNQKPKSSDKKIHYMGLSIFPKLSKNIVETDVIIPTIEDSLKLNSIQSSRYAKTE